MWDEGVLLQHGAVSGPVPGGPPTRTDREGKLANGEVPPGGPTLTRL